MKKHPFFGAVFFLWLSIFLLTFLTYAGYQGWQIESMKTDVPSNPPSVIVVLGSGLRDNHPTPTLIERLNTAAYWGKKYPSIPIIVSGGLGHHQNTTEARAMADYLQSLHIENKIALEEKSKTTFENIKYTGRILDSLTISKDKFILIITSDFHAPRAQWIANYAGWYNAKVFASHTPLWTRPLAWFREYFSWIKGWVFNEF